MVPEAKNQNGWKGSWSMFNLISHGVQVGLVEGELGKINIEEKEVYIFSFN